MKDKILLKHKILFSIFGVIILFSLVFGTGMRMAIKQIEQQSPSQDDENTPFHIISILF